MQSTFLFFALIFGSTFAAYQWHFNVTTTYFYVGEPADASNLYISNSQSAWDGNWESDYGGVDDPDNRNGYYPKEFVPKENPFYFALPYNDFNATGQRKSNAYSIVPWANRTQWGPCESMCKNQWVEIVFNSRTAFAQWEDVGPNGEDDSNYVFGNSIPASTFNNHAGLDVSPAVRDFLMLQLPATFDKTQWRFVEPGEVLPGPWTITTTTSNMIGSSVSITAHALLWIVALLAFV